MSGAAGALPGTSQAAGETAGQIYSRVHPEGWEFTREFEHASVWVDTDKWVAKIEWK